MEILSETLKLVDVYDLSFKTVPRGFFTNDTTRLALDYHCGLLRLAKGDSVQISIYHRRPDVPKNAYLARGTVYKIEEGRFECSFGGLLLLYQGRLGEGLVEDGEIYMSVVKV